MRHTSLVPEPAFFTFPLFAFLVTIAAHAAALWLFPVVGLLDFPHRYGLTRQRLPYPTGVLAVGLFIGFYVSLEPMNDMTLGVLSALLIITIICFVDDRTPLPPLPRLLSQFVGCLAIYLTGSCLGGRICSIANPFSAFFGDPSIDLNGALPILSLFVTVTWLLMTTNALNWFDGIPGQVHAVSTLGFVTIGCLSLTDYVQQPHLALIAFILAGISAGGLFFDFPGPRVVMGDTGAMFFGLMLGVLTIYAGGKMATAFLVLGVPLVDSVLVSLHRAMSGKSLFHGSTRGEHLHHRLIAKGWSQRQVIVLSLIVCGFFGVTALFLSTVGKAIAAGVLFIVMALLRWYAGDRPGAGEHALHHHHHDDASVPRI